VLDKAERNSDSVVPPSDLSESCGLRRLESSSYWEEESEEGKRRRWSIGGLAGASLVVGGRAAGEEEDGAGHEGLDSPTTGGREGSCTKPLC